MQNRKFFVSVFAIVGMFVWAFCAGASAKEVVIGFTGPLSGPGAGYGRDNLNGLKMAAADIDKAGGITVGGKKYSIKIVALDDRIDPAEAVNNARRLRAEYGARVIYNPVFNTIAPLMQINQRPGSRFLLMAYSSTPKIDRIANALTVAIPPPFTAYVDAFSDIAWKNGWRKGAMVVTLGAYGDEWRAAFKKHWLKLGGQITADKPANFYTQTDYSAQLSAALATHPQFLLIGGPSETTGLAMEQARGLGFKGGFILVDQAKMDYIADVMFKGDVSKLGNSIGIAPIKEDPAAAMGDFNTRYGKQFKVHDTFEAGLNYSSLWAVADAMQRAGTIDDPAAIKAAMSQVLPQKGAIEPTPYYGILGDRLLVPGLVGESKDGRYIDVYQYFWWPKDEAAYQKTLKSVSVSSTIVNRYMPLPGYLQ